ncbi:hypothetical protein ACN4EG_02595 [Alkalinema pantanalense CENA528]|uniref:hypothetical protein n=1 Tax=Alkalinema pantanalense TaxID=1620705 RepID=UPI003D6E53D2
MPVIAPSSLVVTVEEITQICHIFVPRRFDQKYVTDRTHAHHYFASDGWRRGYAALFISYLQGLNPERER